MYIFSEFGQNTINNLPSGYYETLSGEQYLRTGTAYRRDTTMGDMEIGSSFSGGFKYVRTNTTSSYDIQFGLSAPTAAEWSTVNYSLLEYTWPHLQQNNIGVSQPHNVEWCVTRNTELQFRIQMFLEGSLVQSTVRSLEEYQLQDVFGIQCLSTSTSHGIRCRNFYHTDTEHRLRNWEFKRLPLISLNGAATSQQLNEQTLGILVGTVLEMKPDNSEIQDADIVGVLTTQQARLRRVSLRTPTGEVHRTLGHKTLPVQELSTLDIESNNTRFYRVEEFISAETEQGMTVEEVDQIRLRTEFKVK